MSGGGDGDGFLAKRIQTASSWTAHIACKQPWGGKPAKETVFAVRAHHFALEVNGDTSMVSPGTSALGFWPQEHR